MPDTPVVEGLKRHTTQIIKEKKRKAIKRRGNEKQLDGGG